MCYLSCTSTQASQEILDKLKKQHAQQPNPYGWYDMHEGMLFGLYLGNYAVEVHKYVGPPPDVEYVETYNLAELGTLQRAARRLQLHGSVTTSIPCCHLSWRGSRAPPRRRLACSCVGLLRGTKRAWFILDFVQFLDHFSNDWQALRLHRQVYLCCGDEPHAEWGGSDKGESLAVPLPRAWSPRLPHAKCSTCKCRCEFLPFLLDSHLALSQRDLRCAVVITYVLACLQGCVRLRYLSILPVLYSLRAACNCSEYDAIASAADRFCSCLLVYAACMHARCKCLQLVSSRLNLADQVD